MKDIYIECNNGVHEKALIAALYDLFEDKFSFLDKMDGICPEMTPINIKKKTSAGVSGRVMLTPDEMEAENEEPMFPADSLYAFELGYDDYLRQMMKEEEKNNTCNCNGVCTCGNGKNYMGAKISSEMKPEGSSDTIQKTENTSNDSNMFLEDSLYSYEVGYNDYLRQTLVPEPDTGTVITFENVEQLIDTMDVNDKVKDDCKGIYRLIAGAKGNLESTVLGRVNLAEFSSIDDVVNVVAICYMLDEMGIDGIKVSPINVGHGNVHDGEKYVPVPVPVTASILKGIPSISTEQGGELTSTLASAVLKYFADDFTVSKNMVYDDIGYGFFGNEAENDGYVRVFIGNIK